MIKLLIYSAKNYDRKYFDIIKPKNYHIDYISDNLSEDTAVLAKGYDAICIFVNDYASAATLDIIAKNGTKILLLRCAGFNNIDLEAARSLNVKIARVPEYSPYAVAEYATGLLLSINRKIHKAYNRVRENNFNLDGLIGMDLHQKTVGIIGYGKIGHAFANIMLGFGCKVIVYDPYAQSVAENAHLVDLSTLLTTSDVISLHCPLNDSTHHIINANTLGKNEKKLYPN